MLQAGLDEVRRVIRDEEPVQPSTKLSTMQAGALTTAAERRRSEPPKLIQSVRGDLDWIVMKALEKDRARRYETATGLAADVQRHLGNEPVLARPPSNVYRLQKLVQRNKLVFAAASAIVLALAAGVALSVWALLGEHRARLEAEKERRQAEINEQKAQAEVVVAQFLKDMLNGVGPSVAQGRDTTMLKEILANTARRVQTDLAKHPVVEAELCYTLGEVYWELGDLENAEAMHQAALSIRTNTLGNKNFEATQSMRRLAHVLWRRGRLDSAERMAKAGVAIQRELFGSANLEVARSLEDLAAILNTKGYAGQAEAALRESAATKEAVLGRDNLEVAATLEDLASYLLSRHSKVAEAEAISGEALSIRKKLLGDDNPLTIIASLKFKATELDFQGRSCEEEGKLQELVAAQRKLLGNEHPDLAQSLNLLASALKNEDKLADSEVVRREALSIQQKHLGEVTPEVGQTLFNLGELLTDEGKLAEAETIHREALNIRKKVFGQNSTLLSMSLASLGQVLEKEGKADEARSLYSEAAKGKSVSAAGARFCLGDMYLRGSGVQRNVNEAAKWLRQSADLGNSHAQVDLAALYFNGNGVSKDEAQAMDWFQKAADQRDGLAMKTLANCLCSAGRSGEAAAVLSKVCTNTPSDSDAWLTLAVWQAWFGKESDFEATCRSFVKQAQTKDQPTPMMRAAKAACLLPSIDSTLLAEALDLAKRGVELKKGSTWLPWYQLSLGLAEYRSGQYANAEQTLADSGQAKGRHQDILETPLFFRALSLFRLGRLEEARKLFSEAGKQMPPFPQDENKPLLDGSLASHDVMICWLSCREARSVLYKPGDRP